MTRSTLSLLLLAGVACLAFATSAQAARRRELLGKSPSPLPASTRKGMGWVGDQFSLVKSSECDSTFYHSSLSLDITRPDRWSFCFEVGNSKPTNTYSCHSAASVGQVDKVQVLVRAGCSKALDSVTVDGAAWPHFFFDSKASILGIDKLSTARDANATTPSNHRVCISLKPEETACNSINEYCAPVYGPDSSACGILIADKPASSKTVAPQCCPVYRTSFGAVPVQASYTFRVTGRFTGTRFNCALLRNNLRIREEVMQSLIIQYAGALRMLPSQFDVMDSSCKVKSFTSVITMTGLTNPDTVVSSSANLLKPIGKVLGLTSIQARPYVATPSPSPKPRSPKPSTSPSPSPKPAPTPSPSPAPTPSPAPVPSPSAGPSVKPPVYPDVPTRATPPSPPAHVPVYGSSLDVPVYGSSFDVPAYGSPAQQ